MVFKGFKKRLDMRVLFIGYTDFSGGAARATYWLAKGLISKGVDVQFLVENKYTDDHWVKKYDKSLCDRIVSKVELWILSLIKSRVSSHWSLNLSTSSNLKKKVKEFNPDIINLHWVGNSMFNLKFMKSFKVPFVLSLYDMWFFTAGCHYDNFCGRFVSGCKACPQLKFGNNISPIMLWYKSLAFKKVSMRLVAPSVWLKGLAENSTIVRENNVKVELIPHGTDLSLYKRTDKGFCRFVLGLSNDVTYLLFGSMSGVADGRKGFQYLLPAIKKMHRTGKYLKVELLVLGDSEPREKVDIGFDVRYLGRIHDDVTLKVIYSAADVVITPSLQEAFGMTASEAMACGTPVVAFNVAGAIDVVDHKVNGYLVKPFDVDNLIDGIDWVIRNLGEGLSESARLKCLDKFDLDIIASDYLSLYRNLLDD